MPPEDGPMVFDVTGAPAPVPTPDPTPTSTPDQASTTDTSLVPDATQEEIDLFEADPNAKVFDREYVSKLRGENAKHRTALQPYRDTFGDIDEAARDYLLDVNRGIVAFAKGDRTAVEDTVAELEYLLSQMKPAEPTAEELKKQAEEENRPLTVAEWRQIQAKEAEEAAAAESAARMWAEVESLGYSKDIKADPYGETAALLAVATANGGDFKAAAEARAKHFEAELEKAVAQRIEEIRNGTAKWPSVSDGGGAPAPVKEHTGPRTKAQRRQALDKRLDSIFAAQDGTGGGN